MSTATPVASVSYDAVLDELEAEAIHIYRETAAAFKNPVLLYSIGKDSSVLLHLAIKAFAPAPIPFPVMHIDTGWKFQEMIAFRDRRAAELGLDLRIAQNTEAIAEGVTPFTHGTHEYTRLMKTVALREGIDRYGFDAAVGGARRDEERSRAKERIFSLREPGHQWDPRKQRPGVLAHRQHPVGPRPVDAGLPPVQLDRARRVEVHPARGDPDPRPVLREGRVRSSSVTAR